MTYPQDEWLRAKRSGNAKCQNRMKDGKEQASTENRAKAK